ncbi:MAG: 50S ribosomal protein L11 methyltransferase, partial [Bacteroidaceae bacterium]|nr:50S ribosomal protein L11 methyltransferase [Bacteroidaceae bacterium]
QGKHIIDAGTGTGILSIMAIKRGAKSVFAYDIDEWSVENTKDNLLLNHIYNNVVVLCGDSSVLEDCEKADLLIANINRNILLGDLPRFASSLKPKGQMILSGFYLEDIQALTEAAEKLGFSLQKVESELEWAMLLFEANALGRRDI